MEKRLDFWAQTMKRVLLGAETNDEEFNAVCSWNSEQEKQQVNSLQNNFENLWNQRNTSTRLFDLPEAIKLELLKIRPKSNIEYQDLLKDVLDDIEKHQKNKDTQSITDEPIKEKDLHDYQKSAIEKWTENNFREFFPWQLALEKPSLPLDA